MMWTAYRMWIFFHRVMLAEHACVCACVYLSTLFIWYANNQPCTIENHIRYVENGSLQAFHTATSPVYVYTKCCRRLYQPSHTTYTHTNTHIVNSKTSNNLCHWIWLGAKESCIHIRTMYPPKMAEKQFKRSFALHLQLHNSRAFLRAWSQREWLELQGRILQRQHIIYIHFE